MSEIASVSQPDFSATARREADGILVKLEGDGNMDVVAPLGRMLSTIHETASRDGVPEVRVDMRTLEFMNSSCFKCFIDWIARIDGLEPSQQYRVRFVSNPTLTWQKRSLRSLQCFAVELITIE